MSKVLVTCIKDEVEIPGVEDKFSSFYQSNGQAYEPSKPEDGLGR